MTNRSNKKSWVNNYLYENWFAGSTNRRDDRKEASWSLLTTHRNILLPVPATWHNSCSTHGPGYNTATEVLQAVVPTHHHEMDKSDISDCELLKQITVLDTIYEISLPWKAVDVSTIIKCFNKCGFNNVRQTPPARETEEDLDNGIPILELSCMRKKSTGLTSRE